jgi:hypothetical protein
MNDEAMRRLRRENPVPETMPALPIETLLGRLDHLEPERPVDGSRAAPCGHRRHGRRHPSRRIVPALSAAVAVALGVVIVAVVIAFGSGSTAPSSAAAAELQRLAGVAAAQRSATPPASGYFLHVASIQAGGVVQGNCTAIVPQRRQIWINAAGAGRILEIPDHPSFLSAQDRLTCERSHEAMLRDSMQRSDTWYAAGCYDLGDASRLTGSFEDPQTLLRKMHAIHGGPSGPSADFETAGDFLRESDASPALRAAIYRAAATIPGVRLVGPVTDRLGRHGIAMSLTSHDSAYRDTTFELIFAPRDSTLLAEQITRTSTGQQIGWGVYDKTTLVRRIPGAAPSRISPPCGKDGLSYGHPAPGGVTIMTGAPR